MPIEIHNLQSFIDVDLDLIIKAVELAADQKDPDISISIVDDKAIHEVNKEHLDHDFPTDVISFDYRDESEAADLSGEMIVSGERAYRIASDRKTDPVAELALYIIHGVLHLKGMDDQEPDDAKVMWRLQNTHLTSLGFSGELES